MLNIKSESISKINNKLLDNHNVKPNEDYFISDDLNNIYIVTDGISRPKVEYQYDFFLIMCLNCFVIACIAIF